MVSAFACVQKTKKVDALKQQGNDAFKSGDSATAVQKYQEALEVDPSNGDAATADCYNSSTL